jgi:hypothetical protein
MYNILELKRPSGRTVAIVESFNLNRYVSFAESEYLKKALEQMLTHGLNIIIPRGKEQIEIKTTPEDVDFLEEIGRYMQLSFDFFCNYYIKADILPQSLAPMNISFVNTPHKEIFEKWPIKEAKESIQFNSNTISLTISVPNSSNWL